MIEVIYKDEKQEVNDGTVISLLVLPRFFGVNGAWLAIPVAEFVTLLLSIWMHRKYLYRFI